MKKNLPALLEDLYSSHSQHRLKAIKFLGDNGDKSVLDLLKKHLGIVKQEHSLLEEAISKLKQRLK